jgi:hypothetical protein
VSKTADGTPGADGGGGGGNGLDDKRAAALSLPGAGAVSCWIAPLRN